MAGLYARDVERARRIDTLGGKIVMGPLTWALGRARTQSDHRFALPFMHVHQVVEERLAQALTAP